MLFLVRSHSSSTDLLAPASAGGARPGYRHRHRGVRIPILSGGAARAASATSFSAAASSSHGNERRLTATPSSPLQSPLKGRVGLTTAPPSPPWHLRRSRSRQGPSFVGPGALRKDAPQADSRQRRPEGPPGTYQVLGGYSHCCSRGSRTRHRRHRHQQVEASSQARRTS